MFANKSRIIWAHPITKKYWNGIIPNLKKSLLKILQTVVDNKLLQKLRELDWLRKKKIKNVSLQNLLKYIKIQDSLSYKISEKGLGKKMWAQKTKLSWGKKK